MSINPDYQYLYRGATILIDRIPSQYGATYSWEIYFPDSWSASTILRATLHAAIKEAKDLVDAKLEIDNEANTEA